MSPKNHPEIPPCFTITHRHQQFNSCLARLMELVRMKTSTRIVIVSGPTGVGKSTLIELLCDELVSLAAAEMAQDPEVIAFGRCAVKAPGPTAFSWKDPYLQMLQSLHHPFADYRLMTAGKSLPPADKPMLKTISRDTAHSYSNDRLFRILQRTITHRKPKAVIFDEAHHLLRVASSQSLINQLEHLKFIADETQTLHILFGTYELIKLMDLSSALIRRREVVHFPRYIFDPGDTQGSLEDFGKVVAFFAKDLADVCDFELLQEVPYLYQGSVGCVGVLRDWMFRSFTRAQETKGRKISKPILEQTMLAASDRLALINDARDGETYFANRSLCEKDYLARLGFVETAPPSLESVTAKNENMARSRKPGVRKPHNDPVGPDHLNPNYGNAA